MIEDKKQIEEEISKRGIPYLIYANIETNFAFLFWEDNSGFNVSHKIAFDLIKEHFKILTVDSGTPYMRMNIFERRK